MLTANPAFHSKTKHFMRDHHYIRERVAMGAVEVKHISNRFQIADIFTKSIGHQWFDTLRRKLGVYLPPTPSLRVDIKAQVWKPKTEKPTKERTTSQPSKSSTCAQEHDRVSNGKQKQSEERTNSSSPATAIATANRFSCLEDKEETSS